MVSDYPCRVRIFASTDTFIESSQSSLRLGRLVANATFLDALLHHGPFDRYEFFCPTVGESQNLRTWVSNLPAGRDLVARIDFRSQLELPARMAVADWEVIHSGGWSRYLPALAWLRARYAPRAVALTGTIHSLNDPSMAQMLRRLRSAPLRSCDAVICTSRDGREAFGRQLAMVGAEGDFLGRLEVAPLGVSERGFLKQDQGAARRSLALPSAARVALWVGRLSAASKADLHPLLYQWRQVVQETGAAARILILAGSGAEGDLQSLRATVVELGLAASVRILPDIEDSQKADLLAAADVFVSPVDNQQETFGIAVVEAMAAGLPVIASRWDGYKDLVEDGVTGFLIPVRWAPVPPQVLALRALLEPNLAQLATSQGVVVDPGALRRALITLLDDAAAARQMGEAGRQRARQNFAWPVVIERLSKIWAELGREAVGVRDWHQGGGVDPEILDPAQAFGHYAIPDPEVDPWISLSALGHSILAGTTPMPPTFGDLMPISDGKLLTVLVLELRGTRRRLMAHATSCAVRAGASEADATWLLHWLLKYGVLEVA